MEVPSCENAPDLAEGDPPDEAPDVLAGAKPSSPTGAVRAEVASGSKMPCYHPLRVDLDENNQLDWSRPYTKPGSTRRHTNVPCGDCLGCRNGTARDWAVRCYHEALLHTKTDRDPVTQIETSIPNSCMITLTYADNHLPSGQVLNHPDFQNFIKRLRHARSREASPRFFMCGEYGGKFERPHYHAVIFGETFPDQYTEVDQNGKETHMSHELDKLWSKLDRHGVYTKIGRASVDPVTFKSAMYVSGYVLKKMGNNNPTGPIHTQIDPITGEITYHVTRPEYRRMSTGDKHAKGGIGHDWIIRPDNMARVYSVDKIHICDMVFHPPKYYDVLLKRHRPELHAEVVERRLEGTLKYAKEWDHDRCASAETIAENALVPRVGPG